MSTVLTKFHVVSMPACSVARDNPLYVEPAAVTEEGVDGATETTPLDS